MGLDMYLSRKIYIGANWDHNNVKGEINLTKGKDDTPIRIDLKKVNTVTEMVMQWRKANQIHRWFVDNVQDGVDDCKEYWVSNDNLKQLIQDCKDDIRYVETLEQVPHDEDPDYLIFKDVDEDKLKLPTKSGFFFGSTTYDKWYLDDLRETVRELEPLIQKDDLDSDFYYQSSW